MEGGSREKLRLCGERGRGSVCVCEKECMYECMSRRDRERERKSVEGG